MAYFRQWVNEGFKINKGVFGMSDSCKATLLEPYSKNMEL